MKLVKAAIMDREHISIFWAPRDLICAMIYPVHHLWLIYCFSSVRLRCCLGFTLQYQKLLLSASGGWFVGGAAHCSCLTLDPQRDKSCTKSKQLLKSIFGVSCKSCLVCACMRVCLLKTLLHRQIYQQGLL